MIDGNEEFSKRSKQKPKVPFLMTELTLTMIFEEAEEGGFIGCLAELPGVNTQGETLEEVRENLGEAVELILNSKREEFEKSSSNSEKIIRERLVFRVV